MDTFRLQTGSFIGDRMLPTGMCFGLQHKNMKISTFISANKKKDWRMRIRIARRICTANKHGYRAYRKDSEVTFVKGLALPVNPVIKIERERERERESEKRHKRPATQDYVLYWFMLFARCFGQH
jgi:hypothetical protein